MKIDKKWKYKMVNRSDVWEATKTVMRVTNPLTAMMIDVAEKAVGKSSSISENGDIEEMKLEAMRQEISARMSEVQAKVAQELAIDNLYLFSPRNRKGQFKDVSRFIVEGKLNDMPVDSFGYEEGDKVSHKTYGIGEIEELKEDKITLSFGNTLRSFSLKVLLDNNLLQKVE